jgi:hypothetical protein
MEPIIELHSRSCECRGYAWVVVRTGRLDVRARCGALAARQPAGVVRLPASVWKELGMPRTAEEVPAPTS